MSKNDSNGHGPVARKGRAVPGGEGPGRDHRRRQLRLVAGAGRGILPERRSRRDSVPGLMHVDSAVTTSATSSSRPRSTSTPTRSARTCARRSRPPNNTIKFCDGDCRSSTFRSARHDPRRSRQVPEGEDHQGRRARPLTSRRLLKDTRTDVVVSYLPVGSERATKWYVEQILEAGCAFVNCIPVFIAREDYWDNRFNEGRPADHRRRHQVPGRRHHHPPRADAALRRPRREASCARRSSTSAATSTSATCSSASGWSRRRSPRRNAVTRSWTTSCPRRTSTSARRTTCRGSTDRKWAHIRIEGQTFGDVPLNVELKLEVWDSPNSAGVVIDAVRCCKLALNNGLAGQLYGPPRTS